MVEFENDTDREYYGSSDPLHQQFKGKVAKLARTQRVDFDYDPMY